MQIRQKIWTKDTRIDPFISIMVFPRFSKSGNINFCAKDRSFPSKDRSFRHILHFIFLKHDFFGIKKAKKLFLSLKSVFLPILQQKSTIEWNQSQALKSLINRWVFMNFGPFWFSKFWELLREKLEKFKGKESQRKKKERKV